MNIKDIRETEFKLNIADMSRLLNVHRDTYGKWERGERQPSAATVELIKILRWLNTNGLLNRWLEHQNQKLDSTQSMP